MYCSRYLTDFRLATASLLTLRLPSHKYVLSVMGEVGPRQKIVQWREQYIKVRERLARFFNNGPTRSEMARSAGVEPTTFGFGGQHSIQLSYERILFLAQPVTAAA